jgi:phage shock protein PspC (stress-responsive transcriptional regulator)
MNKPNRLYRNPNNRIIAGVCSGLADYFGIDAVIVRLIFIIFFICVFGIILYLAAWIIMPESYIQPDSGAKRLYRSRNERVIAGVCAGLAEYFNTDPVLVRLIAILLFLCSGIGFVTYIIAWVLIPYKD